MPVPNLLNATFHVKTYSKRHKHSRKGFNFPRELFDAFAFKRHSKVALLITELSGRTLFCGVSKFTSGPEITQASTTKYLDFDQKIRVTASHAP
jgi:hypothetical protein